MTDLEALEREAAAQAVRFQAELAAIDLQLREMQLKRDSVAADLYRYEGRIDFMRLLNQELRS